MRPCVTCGDLAPVNGRRSTRCTSCEDRPESWRRLSLRARKLSPVCEDCGTGRDLTTDHTPEAWARQRAGLSIRLRDVAVVCRSCNGRRGRARPDDVGGRPPKGNAPHAASQEADHTPRGGRP